MTPPRLFLAKIWLGGVGLAAGLAGMAWDVAWLVWGAAGVLFAAFLLRFVKERNPNL